ncbi:MAG: hypothetical protein ABL984_12030 [Pyrinomonadaceae bacterium]
MAYIFLAHKTFVEGSRAAKNAVDTFRELGIPGFQIGSAYFSGRNEEVVRGDRLAKELLSEVEPRVRSIILESEKLYQVLEPYKMIIRERYGVSF